MKIKIPILLSSLLLVPLISYNQKKSTLVIAEEGTLLPIKNAHIKVLSPPQLLTSDDSGKAVVSINDSATVHISHISYFPIQKKINEGETIIIYLEKKTYPLQEFVITAQNISATPQQSPHEIFVINKQKLEKKEAYTLTQALLNEMNIRLSYRPAFGSSINLRGFSGEQVNIMIDGIPVCGRLNGNIDLSQIHLSHIDRIEIIHGPVSVIYGSNSAGGVVNVISSPHATKKFTLQQNSYYESVGQYNFYLSTSSLLNPHHSFSVTGGRSFFSGYSPQDTSRHKLWLQREQYSGEIIYSIRYKKFETQISSSFLNELMKDRGDKRPPYYTTAFDTYYYTRRWGNRLLSTWKITPHYYLALAATHSLYHRKREKFFRDLTTLQYIPVISPEEQDTTLENLILVRPILGRKQNHQLFNFQWGCELSHLSLSSDRILSYHKTMTEVATFLNMYFSPPQSKNITLNPGLRWIYNKAYQAPLIYAFNMIISPAQDIILKGSVARGYRAPSLRELYLNFYYNESMQIRGNTTLKAETSQHYHISMEWLKSFEKHSFQCKIIETYNILKNMIATVQTQPTQWQFENIETFYSLTHHLLLQYSSSILHMTGSIGYNGYRYIPISSSDNPSKFFYSPEITFTPSFLLHKIDAHIDISYKYTGKVISHYLTVEKQWKQSFISDYHLLDLTFHKTFFKKRISLGTGIKNILNVTNVPMQGKVYGYATAAGSTEFPVAWGRTFFFSVVLRLEKS